MLEKAEKRLSQVVLLKKIAYLCNPFWTFLETELIN